MTGHQKADLLRCFADADPAEIERHAEESADRLTQGLSREEAVRIAAYLAATCLIILERVERALGRPPS